MSRDNLSVDFSVTDKFTRKVLSMAPLLGIEIVPTNNLPESWCGYSTNNGKTIVMPPGRCLELLVCIETERKTEYANEPYKLALTWSDKEVAVNMMIAYAKNKIHSFIDKYPVS